MAVCAARQPRESNAASQPILQEQRRRGRRGARWAAGDRSRPAHWEWDTKAPVSDAVVLTPTQGSRGIRLRGSYAISVTPGSHPARFHQPRFAHEQMRAQRDCMTCKDRTAPSGRAGMPVPGCLIPQPRPVPASRLLPRGLWTLAGRGKRRTPGCYRVHTQPRSPEPPSAGTEIIDPAEQCGLGPFLPLGFGIRQELLPRGGEGGAGADERAVRRGVALQP